MLPRIGLGHRGFPLALVAWPAGIFRAHGLSKRILAGEKGAVEDYLSCIKVGEGVYPLDGLEMVGVDPAKPHAVDATFDIMAGPVRELEGGVVRS